MSDRQLQQFFLKFALGVAVTLSLELTALHKFLSIGFIAIAAFFVIRGFAIASAWQQVTQFDAKQREYGIYAPQEQCPIDRESLILDTYDLALWALPALIALIFWLPAHFGELLHAFQN